MKLTLDGDFGGLEWVSNDSINGLRIPVQESMVFFKALAIKYPEIALNELNLFSLGSVGNNRLGKFASMSPPSHIIQPRGNTGCIFTPKGELGTDITQIELCPWKVNMQQCPDAFWGECFEAIFGAGNKINDLFGTPAGRAMMGEIIRNAYIGLGNSFFELSWWGKHPIIDAAEAGGYYTGSRKNWEAYMNQQDACGGWMTMIDALKAEGKENFTVDIYASDVDGEKYSGNTEELFERVVAGADGVLEDILDMGVNEGLEPILLVTNGIFNKYKQELIAQYGNLPQSLEYYVNSETIIGGRRVERNTLRWNGYVVHNVSAWKKFDKLTGTITHRVILTAPKNFGMLYDIDKLDQFGGMGLKVTQQLEDPFGGMIYMSTNVKSAAAIVNTDLMVNASLTLIAA